MRLILRFAILASAALTTALAHAADGTQAVTFILDCSASMSAKAPQGDGFVQASSNLGVTRLDVAKQAIREALDRLSVDGDNRVGLVLFGHRLAWQQGVSEPDLMEQTRYLEQTLGFEVLKELLPGDDVEIARHLSRFEPRDLTLLDTRFNALEPWGEDPLYLALQKAVDTFERPGGAERRLIVVTDGGNNQGMAKHKSTKDQVLEAIDRRPVPIYIFRLGDDEMVRQAESELVQIARRSGGDYLKAADAAELGKQMRAALAVSASRPEKPAGAVTATANATGAPVAADVTAEIANAIATLKSDVTPREELKPARLQGNVSYYGTPAKRAKIVLEGEATQVVVRTDSQGNFSVEDVEPGVYTLWTEATVKNTFRYATRKLKVDNSGRTKTLDLILE
ncbi:MAG: hypothetical protein WD894_06815 [Pirellulales bacterium]